MDGIGPHQAIGAHRLSVRVHARESRRRASDQAAVLPVDKAAVAHREHRVGLAVSPALALHLGGDLGRRDGQGAADQRHIILPQHAVGVLQRHRDVVGARRARDRCRATLTGAHLVSIGQSRDHRAEHGVGLAISPRGIVASDQQGRLGHPQSATGIAKGIVRGNAPGYRDRIGANGARLQGRRDRRRDGRQQAGRVAVDKPAVAQAQDGVSLTVRPALVGRGDAQ